MGIAKTIRASALALIIGLTLLPAGLQLTHIISGQSGDTLEENRALEDWPQWAEADNNLASFTANISGFLNDHFGGRAQAIRVRNKLFRLVGDSSVSVLQGQTQGWYFLNDGMLWESYSGRLAFSDQDVETWLSSLRRLQTAAQNEGAVFAAIIPPDKARIYPKHAPARYKAPSDRRFVSALFASARSGRYGLLDIEPAILRAKQDGPVFFKTDTHWTSRGAFQAYDDVMAYYNANGAQFDTLKREDVKQVERLDFSGDLAQLMGLKGQAIESFTDEMPPKKPIEFREQILEDSTALNANWRTHVYQNDVTDGKTLVIVGDSFSNVLIPFFKHSFDHIVVIHHRMGNFDLETALSYDPDAVLFAPVERTAVTMRDFARP